MTIVSSRPCWFSRDKQNEESSEACERLRKQRSLQQKLLSVKLYLSLKVKPGFHTIARITSDARIAENCNLRYLYSLGPNGNYLKKSIAILATLAIVVVEIENLYLIDSYDPCVFFQMETILWQASQGSLGGQVTIFGNLCVTCDPSLSYGN